MYLVTGGGGFLGGAIVRQLVARGERVRTFARGSYPQLDKLGVDARRGDLNDPKALANAVAGCEVVIHTAAKAGVWGPYDEYYAANVVGTKNVIDACRRNGIRRLVHTSSPSSVFDGRDQDGVDESYPYPAKHLAAYGETKAEAERIVLGSNGQDLATVALRPHLIFGPGDPHVVPRILDKARKGQLRIVGSGQQKIDMTYVDNAAAAHLAAADRLSPGSACAGKAYFITNGEPLPIATLITKILTAAGMTPIEKHVPLGVAHAAGLAAEMVWRALGRKDDPPMTRFVARQLGTAHWFDISAARRDLGYAPTITIDEGMRRVAEWLRGVR